MKQSDLCALKFSCQQDVRCVAGRHHWINVRKADEMSLETFSTSEPQECRNISEPLFHSPLVCCRFVKLLFTPACPCKALSMLKWKKNKWSSALNQILWFAWKNPGKANMFRASGPRRKSSVGLLRPSDWQYWKINNLTKKDHITVQFHVSWGPASVPNQHLEMCF